MASTPKTVRLPMYDSDGMLLKNYLEVDLNFFIDMSRVDIVSNRVKIVQPEEVEPTFTIRVDYFHEPAPRVYPSQTTAQMDDLLSNIETLRLRKLKVIREA